MDGRGALDRSAHSSLGQIETDGTFFREDFVYEPATNSCACPGNKELQTYPRNFSKPRKPNGGKDRFIKYRSSNHDYDAFPLKANCCPQQLARNVLCSLHDGVRDVARDIRKADAYMTSLIQRPKVEMLFAHLKLYIGVPMMRPLGREGAYEQFQLQATAQHLRKLVKLIPKPKPTG